LINKFIINCLDAQDLGREFHYNWVILLLAMVVWKPPPHQKYDQQLSVVPDIEITRAPTHQG